MEFPDQPEVIAKHYENDSPMVVYKKGTKDQRRVTEYQDVIPQKPYTFCNSWVLYLSTL